MASPPFDVAQTLPGDTDVVSQFPANERTNRDVIESWIATNHDTNGRHKYVELIDQASNPTFATGIVGIWNNGGSLRARLASGTVLIIDTFASTTTSIVYAMSAPPVGWNIDNSFTDRVLRFNTAGRGVGGSWTITGFSIDGHQLTVAEMPSHTHPSIPVQAGFVGSVTPGGPPFYVSGTGNTGSTGNDNAHTHGISYSAGWRPLYADVVVGTKA